MSYPANLLGMMQVCATEWGGVALSFINLALSQPIPPAMQASPSSLASQFFDSDASLKLETWK